MTADILKVCDSDIAVLQKVEGSIKELMHTIRATRGIAQSYQAETSFDDLLNGLEDLLSDTVYYSIGQLEQIIIDNTKDINEELDSDYRNSVL